MVELGRGALAQLGEHLLCKQGVVGSIPTGSTILVSSGWVSRKRVKVCGVALVASPVLEHVKRRRILTGRELQGDRSGPRTTAEKVHRLVGTTVSSLWMGVPDRRPWGSSLEAGLSPVSRLAGVGLA